MDNSMKLATLGTQDIDVDKQRKKDNPNVKIEHRFLCRNRNRQHNTELRT
jgi:hypothetical protein